MVPQSCLAPKQLVVWQRILPVKDMVPQAAPAALCRAAPARELPNGIRGLSGSGNSGSLERTEKSPHTEADGPHLKVAYVFGLATGAPLGKAVAVQLCEFRPGHAGPEVQRVDVLAANERDLPGIDLQGGRPVSRTRVQSTCWVFISHVTARSPHGGRSLQG